MGYGNTVMLQCAIQESKTTHLDAHVSEDKVHAVVGALVILEAELSVSVHRVEPIVLKNKRDNKKFYQHHTHLHT